MIIITLIVIMMVDGVKVDLLQPLVGNGIHSPPSHHHTPAHQVLFIIMLIMMVIMMMVKALEPGSQAPC